MDINTISVNLAELLTNSVNMTAVFYDIFLNPNPMIIELQQFDDTNKLVTVKIPNRALDKQIAKTGEGSPEGVVPAAIGTVYINTRDNQIYFKTSGEDAEDPTGWSLVLDREAIIPIIEDYINTKEFLTVPQLRIYLIENGYVTRTDVNEILEDYVTHVDLSETLLGYVPQTQYATAALAGIIKIGKGLSIDENGVVTAKSGTSRNIGEIITSSLPLTDAALHLLDGSLIRGGGVYNDFVNYMARLYEENPGANYFAQPIGGEGSVTKSNIIKYGMVTDVDHVLSGMNVNNFAIINYGIELPTGTTWDYVTKVRTGNIGVGLRQSFGGFGSAYFGDNHIAMDLTIEESGVLGLYLSFDGVNWTSQDSVLTVSANTDYYIRRYFTGTQYKVDVSTTGEFNGEEVNYITYNSTTSIYSTNIPVLIGGGYRANADQITTFLGSVDLKESYINIGGERWWNGVVEAPSVSKTAEQVWQETFDKYGVCGKFVYDSEANTVRLPRIGGFIEGTTDKSTLGSLTDAGLPNITGSADGYVGLLTSSGAFTLSNESTIGSTGTTGNHSLFFDASRSNPIYGNSNTVQPQSIKTLYYIVVATSVKEDIEVDIDKIITDLNNMNQNVAKIFDIVPKDHILDYEESKGFAPLGTYVYKEAVPGARYGYSDFYSKVLAEYQDLNNTTETVSGVTITVNANGHMFYDIADKADIDSLFATRGEAWFYGIDTTNERIFLPRSTRIKFGDTSTVGEYQEAGLPNITGIIDYPRAGTPSGAFASEGTRSYQVEGGSGGVFNYASFNASRSSSVYGNSNTVEYSSTKFIPYMVVGVTELSSDATDIVDVTTTENDTLPLFTGMYFDVTPNNVSWILAGGQVASGDIYTFAYNELINELTDPKYGLNIINVSDMVEGVDYSTYWKVNQDQQYFICPTKLSYGAYDLIDGTIPVKGNGMTLGLMGVNQESNNCKACLRDINHNIVPNSYGYGASATTYNSSAQTNGMYGTDWGVTTDATKSGMVADMTNTQSTAKLYFKVANAVQNLELLDAGEVLETVNHIIPNNSSLIASYAMPSNSYIDLTLGASGATYTAPANGWIEFDATANGAGSRLHINARVDGFCLGVGTGQGMCAYSPVAKNEVVTITYSNISPTSLKFIYAVGSESEAQ